MAKNSRIGLALGGGGARGLAHIGVLKVLIKENIPFDLITGSSMGAIIGGAFALLGDMNRISELASRLPEKIPQLEELQNVNSIPRNPKYAVGRIVSFIKELYVLNLEATRKSLVENSQILPLLEEVFQQSTFEDLKIPFSAVATNLQTGKEVLLNDGLLTQAILASMAIPGIFEPVELNGQILVDGNVTSQVPIEAAKQMGADFVIAVNVEANIFKRKFDRGIDVLFQVDEIRGAEINRLKLKEADIIIQPNIGHINWSQFTKVEECIRRGEEATLTSLDSIREAINRKKFQKKRRFFWPF